MKKIFKLTIFSFAGPFIATFFVVLFVLLMQFLWKYIDDLVGKGLEWYVLLELLFYASASFVPLALPLAILLSSIMSFGRMAETYELVALKSAGVSLLRIMFPLICLVGGISVFAFFFANNVIPNANLKFHSLLWDIRNQRPALDIKEGVFYNGIDHYSIRINKKDKDSRKIEDVKIYDHTEQPGNDIVLTARNGEMSATPDNRWLILNLYDGVRYEEMGNLTSGTPSFPANRTRFDSYEIRFDLSAFSLQRTREELFKDNYQMLNIAQLSYYSDSVRRLSHRKRIEVKDFIRPYFLYMRDTIPAGIYVEDTLFKEANFIENFPKPERREILNRAANTARTLKDVVKVQSADVERFQETIRKYLTEWHRKFSLSLACLTLFFIGAPLGAIIRKGGIGLPTVIAIIMFLIFYIISIVGEKSGKEGAMPVELGMWLSNLVLLPIGLYLTHKANIDAMSFNKDALQNIFRKLALFFTKKDKQKDENTAAM